MNPDKQGTKVAAHYRQTIAPGQSATIRLRLTVQDCKPSSKGGRGVVTFRSEVVKQDGTTAVDGSWTVLFRDRT